MAYVVRLFADIKINYKHKNFSESKYLLFVTDVTESINIID